MTKEEIIERMSAIAHTEQEAVASTAEEREEAYKALLLEALRDESVDYVDLGLSVKWAKCNIGASKPEDNGDYLDWDKAMALKGIKVPTIKQWKELFDNCEIEWTTVNEVNGRKFTSRKNGNSIFLPAAGYRVGTSLYYAGSRGDYWSSSLNTGNPYYAWGVSFYSEGVNRRYYIRYYGPSVRPVSE